MDTNIKRDLQKSLENHLLNKEITLIVGPRQAGKTFLMRIIQERLNKKGLKTLFMNLDIEADKKFFVSQNSLIEKIRLELGKNGGYVFIDEMQRKENAGLFLKGIFDSNLPYKLIVSGSGSLELKEKIHESLAGRKRVFELNTLNFNEFVNFKTEYRYKNKLNDFFALEQEKTQALLKEYLVFGGYPKVVLSQTIEEKNAVMGEIYRSYVEKDIKYLLNLEKTEEFSNLVKVISSQIGGMVNFSEISSTIGLSHKTVKLYLWYLEKTFILKKLTPYFRNTRKEISKTPVYYFYDLGLRNYILNLLGYPVLDLNGGHLFENFVFNILRQSLFNTPATLNFWRTRDNAEIDFVINAGITPIPIEAKFTSLNKTRLSRSAYSFIKTYRPKNLYVTHLGKTFKERVDNSNVSLIPFYQLPQACANL
ncbi:ATPase [candidate division WWE3 bacterium CG10_big_fil_rev_8_21_14_0_10_39_14]|nr:MAG: ATPase [candidate division WWE3 bacterium CG10_big_fil_rev_8_21_14_0_10_39_14]